MLNDSPNFNIPNSIKKRQHKKTALEINYK